MGAFYTTIWVMAGGALGTAARFAVSGVVARQWGEAFPWGTLVVNVAGSFAIGLFAGFAGPEGKYLVAPDVRQFVMVGVFGGFTTFSSFSLQTLRLLQDGEWLAATGNAVLSVVLCVAGVWLGLMCANYWSK